MSPPQSYYPAVVTVGRGSTIQLGDDLAKSQYSISVIYVNTLLFFKFVIEGLHVKLLHLLFS